MLIDYQNVLIKQDDKEVLQHVNFHADEGEFIYIIGKVGSGKTSLLKTFYSELDISQADKAEVLGYDVTTIKRKFVPDLRRQMGIIFQNFQLLSDRTIYENLRFVLKATDWKEKTDIDSRIDEVLTAVEMLDAKDKMPHELSGGEQQRISIARAILNHPKIIIADEPTGNLDAETCNNIVQLLRNISQRGTAVVMTTHNIAILRQFPGIVYRCTENTMQEITNEFNNIDLSEEEEDNQQ
jgi:cell division transport system ATP-binding protein